MYRTSLLFLAFCFISGMVFGQEKELTDEEILRLYEDLRVADVSDGMDFVGLWNTGLLDQSITPLWRDVQTMDHVVRGIAVTARYIPTNKTVQDAPKTYEEYRAWEGNWYNDLSPEPFVEFIKDGTIVVLDVEGDGDTGTVGSYNSLDWVSRGAVGIVSNGGIRDTDEIILQRIPTYYDEENRGRGIRPGRNEVESVNKTVSIGGVQINPGDVIVADGDGVIVVPRKHALAVAEFAFKILEGDKEGRRSLYEKLGRELDESVQND
ncbi:RraA family protein [Gracilimonas mengyeensis]|uniref:Regulator of RNase E activity RraA n=1 Tax=Gracilimonas mengyeensis TaxID=1302730 RepID=A0A521CPU6_9BACT|nr:RraA family protein [Gracilimonas mengyeensis]SMO61395.1 Regulator of RNase E activity RraA [Gracilimonas mengyeensis]